MLDYLLYHAPHFTMAGFLAGALSFIGFCSVVSLFLAVPEAWANKQFPNSKFAFWVSAINDLISRFGALNLREAIAPKQWSGVDRRGLNPDVPVAKP